MRVSEIFYSVQGEGIQIGLPTIFLRLFGCDLRCMWCDTMYAVEGTDFKNVDVEQVKKQKIQINKLNERHSKQVSELGESLKNIGSGGFDIIKFFTDNPIFAGIGIGGLAVGGVILFLVLKR